MSTFLWLNSVPGKRWFGVESRRVTRMEARLTYLAAVLLSSFLCSGNIAAQYLGDAARGASLAESWCVSCHIIDRRGTGHAVDHAPPFTAIAGNSSKSPKYLRRWLMTKHPQMPNLNLEHHEIEDLVVYIRSLSKKK